MQPLVLQVERNLEVKTCLGLDFSSLLHQPQGKRRGRRGSALRAADLLSAITEEFCEAFCRAVHQLPDLPSLCYSFFNFQLQRSWTLSSRLIYKQESKV